MKPDLIKSYAEENQALLPIEMSMDGNKSQQGLPFISKNPEIGEYLADMCAPYGTTITQNEDGTLSCSW